MSQHRKVPEHEARLRHRYRHQILPVLNDPKRFTREYRYSASDFPIEDEEYPVGELLAGFRQVLRAEEARDSAACERGMKPLLGLAERYGLVYRLRVSGTPPREDQDMPGTRLPAGQADQGAMPRIALVPWPASIPTDQAQWTNSLFEGLKPLHNSVLEWAMVQRDLPGTPAKVLPWLDELLQLGKDLPWKPAVVLAWLEALKKSEVFASYESEMRDWIEAALKELPPDPLPVWNCSMEILDIFIRYETQYRTVLRLNACAHEECRKFFIRSKHAPSHIYCCREHGKKARKHLVG